MLGLTVTETVLVQEYTKSTLSSKKTSGYVSVLPGTQHCTETLRGTIHFAAPSKSSWSWIPHLPVLIQTAARALLKKSAAQVLSKMYAARILSDVCLQNTVSNGLPTVLR